MEAVESGQDVACFIGVDDQGFRWDSRIGGGWAVAQLC
jgi:hypothetical protein